MLKAFGERLPAAGPAAATDHPDDSHPVAAWRFEHLQGGYPEFPSVDHIGLARNVRDTVLPFSPAGERPSEAKGEKGFTLQVS